MDPDEEEDEEDREEVLALLLHLHSPQENPWLGMMVVALENRPHFSSRLNRGIQTPGSVKHPTPPGACCKDTRPMDSASSAALPSPSTSSKAGWAARVMCPRVLGEWERVWSTAGVGWEGRPTKEPPLPPSNPSPPPPLLKSTAPNPPPPAPPINHAHCTEKKGRVRVATVGMRVRGVGDTSR